jgi:hypothetical protein
MMNDHFRRVVEMIATLPDTEQERYAERLELEIQLDNQEQSRIAAQLADPQEIDLDALLARADEESDTGEVYDLDSIL